MIEVVDVLEWSGAAGILLGAEVVLGSGLSVDRRVPVCLLRCDD